MGRRLRHSGTGTSHQGEGMRTPKAHYELIIEGIRHLINIYTGIVPFDAGKYQIMWNYFKGMNDSGYLKRIILAHYDKPNGFPQPAELYRQVDAILRGTDNTSFLPGSIHGNLPLGKLEVVPHGNTAANNDNFKLPESSVVIRDVERLLRSHYPDKQAEFFAQWIDPKGIMGRIQERLQDTEYDKIIKKYLGDRDTFEKDFFVEPTYANVK